MNYLEIESVTDGFQDKVHQNLKFKTGKFVWQIRFNTPLDPTTVNNVNLYVTNLSLAPLQTNITYDATLNLIEVLYSSYYHQGKVPWWKVIKTTN